MTTQNEPTSSTSTETPATESPSGSKDPWPNQPEPRPDLSGITYDWPNPHAECEEKIAALTVETQSLREDRERLRADLHRCGHELAEAVLYAETCPPRTQA